MLREICHVGILPIRTVPLLCISQLLVKELSIQVYKEFISFGISSIISQQSYYSEQLTCTVVTVYKQWNNALS